MTVLSKTTQTSEEISALVATFASRIAPLGVSIERVPDGEAAATWLSALRADVEAPTLLIAGELHDVAQPLVAALNGHSTPWQIPASADEARDQPLGVSLARLAVAETGSVLLSEPTLADRAVGLLTTVNVIVCPTNALVPSLVDAAPVLREIALQPGGGYATLVTGPSRTADIELSLTVGVQGPARVLTLFVDDLS